MGIVKPKLMICGYARHGKDTFAELMQKELGYAFASSSHVACKEFIYERMLNEGFEYASWEQCYEDRVNNRDYWYDRICEYNAEDLTKLSRLVYEDSDIYVGIRDDKEFLACESQGVFHLSVWVDASERLPPEPTSSNKITPDMCDLIVNNNYEQEAMVGQAYSVHSIAMGLLEDRLAA